MLVDMEAEGYIGRALNAVDANFSVTLSGVRVAAGEECAGLLDGQIERGTGGQFADIHVAAEDAGWTGADLAMLGWSYSHDTAEGT